MSSDEQPDELTEKIKILATDDEKIKSFGELFTNDSSREILQLLFNEQLTATQISQRTEISLQLVKYHLNKLQDLGVVKISKVEKNSKSQDMKIYTATKFSIVIVPPKLSEKTKESKLLVRSFRHIYKVAGLGIATGLSGLFSLSLLQQEKQIPIDDSLRSEFAVEESARQFKSAADESSAGTAASAPSPQAEMMEQVQDADVQDFAEMQVSATVSDSVASSGTSEFFIPFVIITAILGGLTVFYLWKYFRKN